MRIEDDRNSREFAFNRRNKSPWATPTTRENLYFGSRSYQNVVLARDVLRISFAGRKNCGVRVAF